MSLQVRGKRIARRAVAWLLAAALTLGMSTTAWAAPSPDKQVLPSPSTLNQPLVVVEGNAVVDSNESKNFLGYFEVALKVKTSFTNPDTQETASTHNFQSAYAALRYDTTLLTPVTWDYAPDPENPGSALTGREIPVAGATSLAPVSIDTKKPDCGITASAMVEDITDGTALLVLSADAPTGGVELKEETEVVVVRFKCKAGLDLANTEGKPGYLQASDTPDKTGNPPLVWFANDADAADSSAGQAVGYSSSEAGKVTRFYYYVGAPETKTVVEAETVSGLTKPVTDGTIVLSSRAESGKTMYSYNYNLLENKDVSDGGNVVFRMVNRESYAKNGVDLNNLVTVLYYDWDSSLLGVQVVERSDARKLVNDYVKKNFIHPELTSNTNYASTARTDNYRGKYPHAGPSAEDDKTGVVDNGEDYPLTNKLDYAFLKRPMERELDLTNADNPVPTGKWVQATEGEGDAAKPAVDTKYPYTHGWAVVPGKDPEAVWTTLGVGELTDYKVDANQSAGFTPQNGMDFQFADFNFGQAPITGTVYRVKAVYEPGEELLSSSFKYRMTSEPTYNKFNNLAASSGGAYKVSVGFERSSMEMPDGFLRGVARMREPYVRQQTTTDLRWEENIDLGVDHNLPNPTLDEASVTRTKTTYTKVDVDNGENVDFAMALSARQNKVDYFLTEGFNNNFVVGGLRSVSNFSRSDTTFTVDNYNYYVGGESSEQDNYYDVPTYRDKEGSHGFVLYGTLNNLMEKATRYQAGDIDRDEFYNYATSAVFVDANLRDSNGNDPTIVNQATMRDALVNAAANAANHKENADYWDSELDCARLSYHQLQWFISGAGLLSAAEADARKLTWCHLHKDCADTGSGKPTSWEALMKAAATSPDQIDLLTTSEVEALFHLRDSDGSSWTTTNAFRTKLVAAVTAWLTTGVAATDLTWDQIQYYLDLSTADTNGDMTLDATDLTAANLYGKEQYWWYDGGTRPEDWSTTMQAAVVAKDGRPAALNTLEAAYDKIVADSEDNAEWLKLTENLARNDRGERFESFDDFKAAIQGAAGAFGNTASWGEVQFYILNGRIPSTAEDAAEITSYWWHNGGQKVVDLKTLLLAAENAAKGNTASFDMVTIDFLENTLFLRGDIKGTKFTLLAPPLSLAEIKTKIQQAVLLGGREMTWGQVQYYLIHNTLDDPNLVIGPEEAYYWWKTDGVTGTKITFSGTMQEKMGALIEVVFRTENYGDPDALNALAAANDIFTYLRLVKNTKEAPSALGDLTQFPSVADFSTTVKALIDDAKIAQGITNPYKLPYLTWLQVQYYLLEHAYRADSEIKNDTTVNYWWYDKESLLTEPTAQMATDLETYLASGRTSSDLTKLKNTLTVVKLNNTYFIKKNTGGSKYTTTPAGSNLTAAKTKIGNLASSLIAAGTPYYDSTSGAVNLIWAQIQYYFVLGSLTDAATAINTIAKTDTGWGWAEKGLIPDGVVVPGSLVMMSLEACSPAQQLADLTDQITALTEAIQTDPEFAAEYAQQIADLMEALKALQAALGEDDPSSVLPPQNDGEETVPPENDDGETMPPQESTVPEIPSEEPTPSEEPSPSVPPASEETPPPEPTVPTEEPKTGGEDSSSALQPQNDNEEAAPPQDHQKEAASALNARTAAIAPPWGEDVQTVTDLSALLPLRTSTGKRAAPGGWKSLWPIWADSRVGPVTLVITHRTRSSGLTQPRDGPNIILERTLTNDLVPLRDDRRRDI